MQDLFRYSLGITRQLPLKKVVCFAFHLFLDFLQLARLTTGPEIRGCRPILVTFDNFKVKHRPFQFFNILHSLNNGLVISSLNLTWRTAKMCWARPSCSRGQISTSLKISQGISTLHQKTTTDHSCAKLNNLSRKYFDNIMRTQRKPGKLESTGTSCRNFYDRSSFGRRSEIFSQLVRD